MKIAESLEDIELESRPLRGARLTFLASLLFWPLFLFAANFMLGAPGKTTAAHLERSALIDGLWLYPVAVGLGWYLSKRGLRAGRSDWACLLPWFIPASVFAYWLVYLML